MLLKISLAGFDFDFNRFQKDFGLDLACLEISLFHLRCASNFFALIRRFQAALVLWYTFRRF